MIIGVMEEEAEWSEYPLLSTRNKLLAISELVEHAYR